MGKPIAEVELVKLEVLGFLLKHYESLTDSQRKALKNIAIKGVLDPAKEEHDAQATA